MAPFLVWLLGLLIFAAGVSSGVDLIMASGTLLMFAGLLLAFARHRRT